MELLSSVVGLITWIPQRVWEAISGRRRVSLLVHHAYFVGTGRSCYFLNVTNLSHNREVEVTHVWFALNPQIHALVPDRLPPKRLKPDETWETWVEADRLPSDLGEKIFTLGRGAPFEWSRSQVAQEQERSYRGYRARRTNHDATELENGRRSV